MKTQTSKPLFSTIETLLKHQTPVLKWDRKCELKNQAPSALLLLQLLYLPPRMPSATDENTQTPTRNLNGQQVLTWASMSPPGESAHTPTITAQNCRYQPCVIDCKENSSALPCTFTACRCFKPRYAFNAHLAPNHVKTICIKNKINTGWTGTSRFTVAKTHTS